MGAGYGPKAEEKARGVKSVLLCQGSSSKKVKESPYD